MKRIGPYTVLEELGRGGMAVVYRARDAAGRDVALKVLPRDKGAKALRRFEREVSALGQFAQHPHVVNVHAAGEADGVAYFAMALAAHGSLTQRVSRRGAYAPEAAARLAADLAEGLIAAHSHGVLHRDLKPDNVLFNDADEAVVSDFGLARQVVDAESLTQSGNMLGSPGYMAPEQIRGDGDEQGERTDVYGLGATLYFALTGQAPFEGEHLAGIVHGTLEERPAAPSTLNPAVPPDLDQLCLRCLEKDPAARYPSMAALHAELTAFLAGVPIAAEQSRLAKVAVAACVLTALSVTASWLVVRGRSATEAAEQGLHGPRAPKPEPRLGAPAPAPPPPPPDPRPRLQSSWDVALAQGKRLFAAQDLDEALRHLDHARASAPPNKALEVEKPRLSAYAWRMEAHWRAGRAEAAAQDCAAILAVTEPLWAAARGEAEGPIAGLEGLVAAAELSEYGSRAHAQRMRARLAEGDLRGALRESQLALELDYVPRVIHEQAWILHRLGEGAAAAEALSCCRSLERLEDRLQHDPRGYLLLVALARERGDEAAAQRLLDTLDHSLSPYARHEASLLRDPAADAARRPALERARAQPVQDAAAWVALGRLAWDCRQLDEAERAFAQALALEPTDREALCAWTDLCLEHERWARAAELSLALSESAGARGLGLSRAARAYSALRRYPQALEAARAACDHDPALLHTETAADLAVALASGRRLMDAERLLAPLLQSQDPRLRAVAELAQETARKLNAPAIDSRDLREPWTPGQGAPPPK